VNSVFDQVLPVATMVGSAQPVRLVGMNG
jgi:hypothetical protein